MLCCYLYILGCPTPCADLEWGLEFGTVSVPKIGTSFVYISLIVEAFAAWQWWNYCGSQVPTGKAVLRVNLDETSVCLFQGGGKGTVFVQKRRRGGEPVQRVSRAKRRSCFTHVGLICDRPDLQPLLPQFVIGNFATFLERDMHSLRARCPSNVVLVRQKSAWNNDRLCAIIVRRLAIALRSHLADLQVVLFLDAVRLHTAPFVLRACNDVQIWPVLVPAKTTWLLQPLDTHAFQAFKAHLRERYQGSRAELALGDLDIFQFLECLYDAIRRVLQGRRWSTAFDADGFGAHQAGVSPVVMRQLQMDGPLAIPSTRPTLAQLQVCFPRRSVVPEQSLWRPFDPAPVVAKASPRMPAVSPGSSSGLQVGSARVGRTRSQHRQALAVADAVLPDPGANVGAAGSTVGIARALRLPSGRAATLRR